MSIFTDKGFFRNRWNYVNVLMMGWNLVLFMTKGHWYNAVVVVLLIPCIIWGERMASQIARNNRRIKVIEHETAMLKEARERFKAGLPMTDEFTYYQMDNLNENLSAGVITDEEWNEQQDQVMEGKLVTHGIRAHRASDDVGQRRIP